MRRPPLAFALLSVTACAATPWKEGSGVSSGAPTPNFPVAYSGARLPEEAVAARRPQRPSTARKAPTPAKSGSCGSDAECKGDRVCEDGQCVDPHREAPRGAAPTPSPAAPAPAPPPPAAEPPPVAIADANTPLAVATPQRNSFAIVIGIEAYKDFPAPAVGARADAEAFAELAKRMLGVPERNIRVALDDTASKAEIQKQFAWLKSAAGPANRVYFFFAGYGAPNLATSFGDLVPFDGDPQRLSTTTLTLNDALGALSATGAREIVAFVDAGFTGTGGRSILKVGPRAGARKDSVPPTISLFTAAAPNELAGAAIGGAHGLFSKYLLSGLGQAAADADSDGQVTLAELTAYLDHHVSLEAKSDNRSQTPVLTTGQQVAPRDFPIAWGVSK